MKRALAVILCLATACVVLLASALATMEVRQRQSIVYTDGATIRTSPTAAVVREVLWQPPVALSEAINTAAHEYDPVVSADGQVLAFVRGKAGANADIFIARRTQSNDGWEEPTPLAAINTSSDELAPAFSSDGHALYFSSNRSGGSGGYDLWMAERGENGWQSPRPLPSAVNSQFDEYSPALSPDGSRLYFASNRPKSAESFHSPAEHWAATVRENRERLDHDLYVADIVDGEIHAAVPLHALNSPHDEGVPAISPAGDFLYFASNRPQGGGGFDLYRSRILHGDHQTPANLGLEVNTPANELDPALSMGGFALHFSSDRAPLDENSANAREYNLWYTASREVFTELAATEPLIDWASLGGLVLPGLWWLLLGLLALLALLWLLKGMQSRRLSLLARCLLASLAAHMILLMLLTFWQVTTSLREAFASTGTQIALTSHAGADELASQIRGELTAFEFEMSPASPARVEANVSPVVLTHLAYLPVETAPSPARDEPAPASMPADASIATQAPAFVSQIVDPSQQTVSDVALPLLASQTTQAEPAINEEAKARVAPAPRLAIEPLAAPLPVVAEISPASGGLVSTLPTPLETRYENVAESNPNSGADAARLPMHADVSSVPASHEVLHLPLPKAQSSPVAAEAELTHAAAIPSAPLRASSTVKENPAPYQMQTAEIQPTSGDIGREHVALPVAMAETDSPPAAVFSQPPPLTVPDVARIDVKGPTIEIATNDPASSPSTEAMAATMPTPPLDQPARVLKPDHSAEPIAASASTQIKAGPVASLTATPLDSVTPSLAAPSDSAPAAAAMSSSVKFATPSSALYSPSLDDLALPQTVAPTETLAQRNEATRRELVEQMGGSEATERAVALALQWLAAHQSSDGRWAAKRFDDDCGECRGAAKFDTDVAITALALLCFFGADHTHDKDGPYRRNVERGLNWLLQQQKPDGDYRAGETMYSHGIAAIAIAEAFAMTRDDKLAAPVQRAVDFIVQSAHRTKGGWRYEPGQAGDTSVFGWQIMALISARRAGVEIPVEVLDQSRAWLESVSSPNQPGLYAYQPGHRYSPSMTAEAMFAQQLLGRTPNEPRMQASAEYLVQNPPRWKSSANTYYWYYATLALYQHQGHHWPPWNQAMTEQLLAHQRTDGAAAGSWDPVDNWSKIGGRIYQTALCTLSLEVYYRYLPMYAATEIAATSP